MSQADLGQFVSGPSTYDGLLLFKRAPELMRGSAFTWASDVFAFGSLLHEILTTQKECQKPKRTGSQLALLAEEVCVQVCSSKFWFPRHNVVFVHVQSFGSLSSAALKLGSVVFRALPYGQLKLESARGFHYTTARTLKP